MSEYTGIRSRNTLHSAFIRHIYEDETTTSPNANKRKQSRANSPDKSLGP